MLRLCVSRRRHAAVLITLALVVASSLFLIGTRGSVHVPSDYDVSYDDDNDARTLLRHKGTHASEAVRSSLLTDRKPQGQEDYNPDEPGLYHRRVIFNKANLPVIAKRLAFVHHNQYDIPNLPEDDDDYADATDGKNSNNDVIGDDVTEEEEEEEEDDEYEYWNNPNPVFKPGDFDDVKNSTKPPLQFQDVGNKQSNVSKVSSGKKRVKSERGESKQRPVPLNTSLAGSRVLHSSHSSKSTPLKFISHSSQTANVNSSSIKTVAKNTLDKSKMASYEEPATQLQMPTLLRQAAKVKSNHGYSVVKDHIYWSDEVEGFVPKGMNYEEMAEATEIIRGSRVQTMQQPQWNKCGRPKNQYVVLVTGQSLCVRYRDPHNKLIYGELLSFYLSRMLGFDNIPIVVLSEVNSTSPQWQGQELQRAQWQQGKVVALIEWIKGLDEERSRVKMPPVILAAYQQGLTVTGHHPALSRMSQSELSDLLQWGDMIILDYITGHYDRVASMQDGADREKKPSILSENIRNLRKVPSSGKLWLIDNESGLLDAYELMYKDTNMGKRFLKFHTRMLQTMCVFRKSLIRKIKALAGHADPASVLLHYTKEYEPLYEKLPKVSAFHLFEMHFHSRLKEVTKWVSDCMER